MEFGARMAQVLLLGAIFESLTRTLVCVTVPVFVAVTL